MFKFENSKKILIILYSTKINTKKELVTFDQILVEKIVEKCTSYERLSDLKLLEECSLLINSEIISLNILDFKIFEKDFLENWKIFQCIEENNYPKTLLPNKNYKKSEHYEISTNIDLKFYYLFKFKKA